MKGLHVLSGTVLAVSLGAGMVAAQGEPVRIQLDGQPVEMKVQPHVIHDRTMISADDAAALLDGSYSLADGLLRFTTGSQQTVTFALGENRVQTDSGWTAIDQGAVMVDEQVFVPLRWLLERERNEVTWDNSTRTVHVSNPQQAQHHFVEVEADSLSEAEKAFVEKVRKTRGIHQLDDLYVIARGESPNPGYGLVVVKQEMSETQLTVHVKLTSPEPGKVYPQVISYPLLLGRADVPPQTDIQFVDAETGDPLFQP